MHPTRLTPASPPSLSTIFLPPDPGHEVQGLGEGVVNDSMLPLNLAPAVGQRR